jgi:hypothetical protein
MPSVERREVMGSHMSCIGFPFETFIEFRDLMLRAVENGERIETGRGAYFRWSSGAGAEFWWAKVRNYGGEIEVLADPEDVAGEIVEGGVIKGSFWLSGRPALSSGNPAQGAWREDRTW